MVDQAAPAKKAEKVVPPSPPRVIRDKQTGRSFTRIGFLGEVSDWFIRAQGLSGGYRTVLCRQRRAWSREQAQERSATMLTDIQGGFARVWEVEDYKKRNRAVKVVYKPNIKSKKNKTKVSWSLLEQSVWRDMLRGRH